MNMEINNEDKKILIGLLVWVVILGTTYLLYIFDDKVYLDRFVVYSEIFIGYVLLWLGLKDRWVTNDTQIKKDILQPWEVNFDDLN